MATEHSEDETEPTRVMLRPLSAPPPAASKPRNLPSLAPATDDIDTDWGLDPERDQPRDSPESHASSGSSSVSPPVSVAATPPVSVAPPLPPPVSVAATPPVSVAAAPPSVSAVEPARAAQRSMLPWVALALGSLVLLLVLVRPRAARAPEPARAASRIETGVPLVTASAAEVAPATPSPVEPAPAPARSIEIPPVAIGSEANGPSPIRVMISTVPSKAKFTHFGKLVGISPFTVQLNPGESHAYEVSLPGHVTRRLFVDGTKTQITIGLRESAKH